MKKLFVYHVKLFSFLFSIMVGYNSLLRNKLIWMAQQLRYINDHVSIMNWTAAMAAVKSLIDNEAVSISGQRTSAARTVSKRWGDFSHRRRKRRNTNPLAARPHDDFLSRRSISLPGTKNDQQAREVSLNVSTCPLSTCKSKELRSLPEP